jgi:hypothetical protein
VATFLTTPAMHPALRARVERAVSPRRRARHHQARAGVARPFAGGVSGKTQLLRLFPVLVAVVLVGLAFASYRAERRAVAEERTGLLAALDEKRAQLPGGHQAFVAATDRWISEAARETDRTDVIAPSAKGLAALDGWLHRPAVYVRLPAAAAAGDARAIDAAARASSKDSFLVCLLKPPPSRAEKDLLTKVRGVYFGGAKVEDDTSNVRRLADAHVGLSAVGPSFEGAARGADGLTAVRKLRRELDGAPVAEAAKAAAAELFIVVVDEATEARVLLVDLATKSVLLRVRRPLEEPGPSPTAMVHREQLQGCALAMAARHAAEE